MQTELGLVKKTLTTNPIRRCKLTPLRRNYSDPKIHNDTIV